MQTLILTNRQRRHPLQSTGNPATDYRWNWVSLALALLWLATLAAWWRSSRCNSSHAEKVKTQAAPPAVSAPGIAETRRAFQQACRENNAQAARRHLLEWAHATWPQDPPKGLNALASRLDDAALKPLLNQLDRACYTDSVWQGAALQELKSLSNGDKQVVPAGMKLAGLYP